MTEVRRKIEGIILYKDKMKTALDTLDDEQLGCLLRAFLDWAWNGTEPQFSDLGLRYAFNDWKTKAKEDFAKYDRVVDRNRANGRLGGRPKKEETQENPKNPNNNNNNNININNINKKEIACFSLDGKHIKTFENIKQAAYEYFTSVSIISKCIKNNKPFRGIIYWKRI